MLVFLDNVPHRFVDEGLVSLSDEPLSADKVNARKERITQSFSTHAATYDEVAGVQWKVAEALANRVADTGCSPRRILEIGCGTGFLSARMHEMFPTAEYVITDISQDMLDKTRQRVGDGATYQLMDGEHPYTAGTGFDLIVSSLAFQWFCELDTSIRRLTSLLSPKGHLMFATLGDLTFQEWRAAHAQLGLTCGTPSYPAAQQIHWPQGHAYSVAEDMIVQNYRDGRDFVHSLKTLGAGEPSPHHRPVSAGSFRRLLSLTANGFAATYHVIYGRVDS